MLPGCTGKVTAHCLTSVPALQLLAEGSPHRLPALPASCTLHIIVIWRALCSLLGNPQFKLIPPAIGPESQENSFKQYSVMT